VPAKWNGVVINDLDYVGHYPGSPSRDFLFERGFALSGTRRVALHRYDTHYDIANQVSVLDIFREEFGEPRRTIQIGCSRGSAIALAMAEMHADRVDGVIAMCGQSLTVFSQMWLDLAFSLKALLAPGSDLPVIPPPQDVRERMSSEEITAFLQPWKDVLTAAHETPLGRARTALGLALGQWPFRGAMAPSCTPSPNASDPEATQLAMLECAVDGVSTAVFVQNCTPQGIPCWNTDVDYVRFYAHADRHQKQMVSALYRDVGADPTSSVMDDLERINRAERIEADSAARAFWRSRALTGKPGIPVIHAHTMDAGAPPALMRGYETQVRLHKRIRLYRHAFIGRAGHCAINVSETAALVEAMMRRIDTGRWFETMGQEQLNSVAASFAVDQPAFVDYRLPLFLNRTLYSVGDDCSLRISAS
jgi:pimeloyl-ACP methyl ester carboxylesterase